MIETGITFDDLERESRPPLVDDGLYEFQVVEIVEKTTSEGRPRWNWKLQIMNSPNYNNRSLFYGTPMPWIKQDGSLDTSGAGFLINILNGTGKRFDGQIPLPGSSFGNNLYPPKELFYGGVGIMNVTKKARKKQNPADPEEEEIFDNDVRIVTKRRNSGGTVA